MDARVGLGTVCLVTTHQSTEGSAKTHWLYSSVGKSGGNPGETPAVEYINTAFTKTGQGKLNHRCVHSHGPLTAGGRRHFKIHRGMKRPDGHIQRGIVKISSKSQIKATMDMLKHIVLFFFCMYRPSPWKTPDKPCLCLKFVHLVVILFFPSLFAVFGFVCHRGCWS